MSDIYDVENAFMNAGFATEFDVYGNLIIKALTHDDSDYVEWIVFREDGKCLEANNTDQSNIWLSDNPNYDLDDNAIYEIFSEVADIIRPVDVIALSDFIDPEDWQELAGIANAMDDERFTDDL